jgi:hypothetical protein
VTSPVPSIQKSLAKLLFYGTEKGRKGGRKGGREGGERKRRKEKKRKEGKGKEWKKGKKEREGKFLPHLHSTMHFHLVQPRVHFSPLPFIKWVS